MSGIAGVVNQNGRPASLDMLRRMTDSLAVRGPDALEIWTEGVAGFGNAMLRSTPESVHERQPCTRTSLTITADARIDNRDELIRELDLTGSDARDLADCGLILRAYEKWGPDCVHHLLGDFAFAVWDARNRQLFCARDHFGVKPLCYFSGDDVFVFASEARGILAVDALEFRLNEARVADFLVEELEGYDKVSTFYEGIFKLPPAHSMIVSDKGVKISKYWAPEPLKQIRFRSDDEYLEAFRDILTSSIKCRIRARRQVGILLSGGIDSATILGTVRRINDSAHGILALSGVSPPDVDCLETRLIRQVLDDNPVKAVQIRWDEIDDYLPEIDKAILELGEPYDLSMSLHRIMYINAARSGINVVLDGIDADVITSTTVHISDLLHRGKLFTAVSEAKGLSYFFKHYYSPADLLYRGAKSAFTPHWIRGLLRQAGLSGRARRAVNNSIINPDFAGRVNLKERLKRLDSYRWAGKGATLADKHAIAMNHPYLTVGIERFARVSAAHSVETRHPFLDRRLAEFCLALPWDQKIRRGWTKLLMRRMMKGQIPESVRWRRGREHLGAQFNSSFISQRRVQLLNVIRSKQQDLTNFINPDALNRIINRYDGLNSADENDALIQAGALGLFLESSSAY